MESIDSAIAILGTYIALMAVLAVAVEAVISWLKIPGWSPLKGKPSPEDVLKNVAIWLTDEEKQKSQWRIDTLNKALKDVEEVTKELTAGSTVSEINEAISKATDNYFRNEKGRRGWIRFLAILLGILFAFIFQIDTLEILSDFTEPARIFLGSASRWVGIILSGLAASAGSSFWHDQSARLRNLKDVKAKTSEILSP